MSFKYDWNKIRNEYINENISYKRLAEKHNVNLNTLQDRARKERWFKKRKAQHEKISEKTIKKTAEKIANKESDRIARINKAADKLVSKIEQATEQLDLFLAKDKRKYTKQVKDPKTGKLVYVDIEEEMPKSVSTGKINKAELKQLASALKDLSSIQFAQTEEKSDDTSISIQIMPATADDMKEESDD